jgi:Reverse transcriptase (RNA-dependent DNA polymerase).
VIRLDGKESETFEMETGVKQGDSLSPLLFITMMDEIHKICKAQTGRMKVGNWMKRPIQCQVLI